MGNLYIPQGLQAHMRMDANETVTLENRLKNQEATLYRQKFQERTWNIVFPTTISNQFTKSESFIYMKEYGEAEWATDSGAEPGLVNASLHEEEKNVRKIHKAFKVTYEELQFAAKQGFSLSMELPTVARRVVETKVDSALYLGDSAVGVDGLLTDAASTLSAYTVPSTGTGSTKTWSTKTGQNILDDITGLFQLVISATGGVYEADTLLLPPDQLHKIRHTYIGDNRITVYNHLMTNYPGLRIYKAPRLKAVSSLSSLDVMVAFPRSKEVLNAKVPIPFMMKPPSYDKGWNLYRECFARIAGLERKHPKAIAYGSGI